MRRWKLGRRARTFVPAAMGVALLVVVWITTLDAVDRAADTADERRVEDRGRVAAVFAHSVDLWLGAGSVEVGELAAQLGGSTGAGANATIAAFLDQGRAFARSAILVDGQLRTLGASIDRLDLTGRVLATCTRSDAAGELAADTGFADLVAATRATAEPRVSGVFDAPGDCQPSVAAAATTGAGVVIVFGELDELGSRLQGATALGDTVEVRAIGPSGRAVAPGTGSVPLPAYLEAFVGSGGGDGPRARRLSTGGANGTEVIAGHAPADHGWSVIVTEDAAAFDIDVGSQPVVAVAGILTAVFVGVLVVVAVVEVRRRRAHRRAELAKEAFFSIVSHELRTPLTVLEGAIDTLTARWDDIDDPTRHSMVDGMPVQAHRLGQVVDRLLTAAHIYGGTHAMPDPAPTPLEPVITAAVDEAQQIAPLHAFEIDVVDGADVAQADPRALEQVLAQVLDNAVRFSPGGGTVEVTTRRRRRTVEIVVDDEGVGLPSNPEPLFEAFTQAEPVLRRVHAEGGVGVGLYIARSLTEAMGGTVRAEPRSDADGARFVVSLRQARA